MREKSWNGYKKIATCLKMALFTIRAILKKFKATGTVKTPCYFSGKGCTKY